MKCNISWVLEDIKEFMLFGANVVDITLIGLLDSKRNTDQSRPGKGAKVAGCFHGSKKG